MKHESGSQGPPGYDIIVVGGGHAGIEASLASSRMGCRTLLVTMDFKAIGRMSCNPAIGGTAKGHLVREIDALGGAMGSIADATGIHFRMLNKSKGPAVWSPRCQNDRDWYALEAQRLVAAQPNLDIAEDRICDVETERGRIRGARLDGRGVVPCKALILCSGTFLSAVMHTGRKSSPGGRFGEPSSEGLSTRFRELGFRTGRLKTGTPPRISRKSIDFSQTEKQEPDSPPVPFSHRTTAITNRQIPMYLTYTNQATHDTLRTGFQDSPMFSGRITGVGPRYCPSIEDKIDRFADRDRHQIFLEPEGYETDVVYVNGFSTSLPDDVQEKAIRTIPGLEQSDILRYGYAVEYDFFPPYQLEPSLETKPVKGLFFAGQINGTSGYEEAAAQGIMAGINAVMAVRNHDPVVLKRSDAYIGVLIDDLINKGTEEPYRIFTSRAEYRLQLRQDNADSRLMRRGNSLGLVSDKALRILEAKERNVEYGKKLLDSYRVSPERVNPFLKEKGSAPVDEPVSLGQLLRRAELTLGDLLDFARESGDGSFGEVFGPAGVIDRTQIEVKYEGYLKRQEEQIRFFAKHEAMHIPDDFDFSALRSLSNEGKEKLQRIGPKSIGQAMRISGVTPADIAVLMIHLKS